MAGDGDGGIVVGSHVRTQHEPTYTFSDYIDAARQIRMRSGADLNSAGHADGLAAHSLAARGDLLRSINAPSAFGLSQESTDWSASRPMREARAYAINDIYGRMAANTQQYVEKVPNNLDRHTLATVRAFEYALAGANVPSLEQTLRSLDGDKQTFDRLVAAVQNDMQPLGLRMQSSFENGHGTVRFSVPGRIVSSNTICISTDGTANTEGTEGAGPAHWLARQLAGPSESIRGMAMHLSTNAIRLNEQTPQENFANGLQTGQRQGSNTNFNLPREGSAANPSEHANNSDHAPPGVRNFFERLEYQPSVRASGPAFMFNCATDISSLGYLFLSKPERFSKPLGVSSALLGATSITDDLSRLYHSDSLLAASKNALAAISDAGLIVGGVRMFKSPTASSLLFASLVARGLVDLVPDKIK
ncbi:MAG TPA: hypothetical protein V6C69_03150 [Trichormus sp.]|jgi:hypothetical protein